MSQQYRQNEGPQVTMPFDPTKPEARPVPITFFTDEDTARWLDDHDAGTGLGRSLIVHRIVKQARDASTPTDDDKLVRRAAVEADTSRSDFMAQASVERARAVLKRQRAGDRRSA